MNTPHRRFTRPLSAIDIQTPTDTIPLVQHLETWGYKRFWTTEHHGSGQSASPVVLAGVLAATTNRIRIGTAGVMLRYYSPYKLAEDVLLINAIFPGRFDIGLIGGRATDPAMDGALLDGRPEAPEAYCSRVAELTSHVRRTSLEGLTPSANLYAPTQAPPEVWMCSLSLTSARLAGREGLALAFNVSLCSEGERESGPEIVDAYRQSFCKSCSLDRPYVAVVCYGTCAETSEAAAALRPNRRPATPTRSFFGSPNECVEQLEEVATDFNADELVVQQFASGWTGRIEGYHLLAAALDLLQ